MSVRDRDTNFDTTTDTTAGMTGQDRSDRPRHDHRMATHPHT
jgi:hypothetical protein